MTEIILSENEKLFIKELTKLSHKHGLFIVGGDYESSMYVRNVEGKIPFAVLWDVDNKEYKQD